VAKQDRQSLPSPLDRVMSTGVIGGNGRTENHKSGNQESHISINHEKQEDSNQGKSVSVSPEKHINGNSERQEDSNQDGGEMKKQTILISKQLAKRIKVYATQHDTSISDIATTALEQYLAKHGE